ncbi:MAG TPA: hypothetical protein PKM65_00585 [Spirochaetota bacterium]|nr:hypothetical protein [Spirochaetota bacterium]HNT11686.1 hypothetical protein [Spirochaetota bacterium]
MSIYKSNPRTQARFANQDIQSAISICIFQLTSFLGKLILGGKPPRNPSSPRLLNLGAGNYPRNGWVNADFFSFHPLVLIKYKRVGINWLLDARHPLSCEDNHWDGVFTEHMLEHLTPKDAIGLLSELLRTLKPGKWLRISVPDLETYINYYNGSRVDEQFGSNWETGAEAIYSLTRCFGHQSVWDYKILNVLLSEIGYTQIKKVRFGKGADMSIVLDNPERKWESVYIEARKPLLIYNP